MNKTISAGAIGLFFLRRLVVLFPVLLLLSMARGQPSNPPPRMAISQAAGPISMTVTGVPGQHYLIQSADTLPSLPSGFSEQLWSLLPAATRESLLPPNQWRPHHLRILNASNAPAPVLISPAGGVRFFRAVEYTGAVERLTFLRRDVPHEPFQKLNVSWVFTNDAPGLEQLVRLRAPGASSTDSHNLLGSPPPTGRAYFLTEAGQWTTNETVLPGFGGILTNALPEALPGNWRVEFLLRDPITGNYTDFSLLPFLVSASPAITLNLSRPIANTNDVVRASVEMSAGPSPQAVKLVAWLVKPDGTQLNLPSFTPGLIELHNGPSTNASFHLFRQRFPVEGAYRVEARLVDGYGNVLGLGRREFQICAGNLAVTGMVYSAEGNPLGHGASTSAVNAFNIDDLSAGPVGTISASGAFNLALTPGRYLISASVFDANGFHKTTNANLIELICGGTNGSLSLTTAPAFGPAAGHAAPPALTSKHETESPSAAPSAADSLPAPRILIMKNVSPPFDTQTAELLETHFQGNFASPDLNTTTEEDIAALLGLQATQMLLGSASVTTLAPEIGADFLVYLQFRIGLGGTPEVVVSLYDAYTAVVLRICPDSAPDYEGMIGAMESAAQCMLGATTQPILRLIRDHQNAPLQPYLAVSMSPGPALPNTTISATAILREKDSTGALQADKPVIIRISRPDGSRTSFNRTTDANGEATVTFDSGAGVNDRLGSASAEFYRNGHLLAESLPFGFRVLGANDSILSLNSPQAQMQGGEQAPIVLTLAPPAGGGSSGANIVVTLSANNGTLTSPGGTPTGNGVEVITVGGAGNTGVADLTLTAGGLGGFAQVTASCTVTNNGVVQVLSGSLVFAVNSGLQMLMYATPPVTYAGLLSQVVVETLVDGARIPGLPLTFTLQGNGGVLTNVSAFTDNGGRAEALFIAPTNPATGTSLISAVLTFDGQNYTNSFTIGWEPPPECAGITNANYCLQVLETATSDPGWTVALNDLGDVLIQKTGSSRLWKRGVFTSLPYGAGFINNRGEVAGTDAEGGWLLSNGVTNRLSFSPINLDDEGWVYYYGAEGITAWRSGVTVTLVFPLGANSASFIGRSGAMLVGQSEIVGTVNLFVWDDNCYSPDLCSCIRRSEGGWWVIGCPIVHNIVRSKFSLLHRNSSQQFLIENPPESCSGGFGNLVCQPPAETLNPLVVNSRGEMIGVRSRPDQPDEFFIGIPPGTPLVVPGNTTDLSPQALNSHGEALFWTFTDGLIKQWHRKGGINRELKGELPTVPGGWQMEALGGMALNENGQMLVSATRQNGGTTEYALWLVTPLHR